MFTYQKSFNECEALTNKCLVCINSSHLCSFKILLPYKNAKLSFIHVQQQVKLKKYQQQKVCFNATTSSNNLSKGFLSIVFMNDLNRRQRQRNQWGLTKIQIFQKHNGSSEFLFGMWFFMKTLKILILVSVSNKSKEC